MKSKLSDQESFGLMGAAPAASFVPAAACSASAAAGASASAATDRPGAVEAAARDLPMFMWSGVWPQLVQFCSILLAARTNGSLVEADRVSSETLFCVQPAGCR